MRPAMHIECTALTTRLHPFPDTKCDPLKKYLTKPFFPMDPAFPSLQKDWQDSPWKETEADM